MVSSLKSFLKILLFTMIGWSVHNLDDVCNIKIKLIKQGIKNQKTEELELSNCAKRHKVSFFLLPFLILFIVTSTQLVLISLEILNGYFQSSIWMTISKELSHVSHAPVKALKKHRPIPRKTKIMSTDLQKDFLNTTTLFIPLSNSYMVQIPTIEADRSRLL